MVKSPLEDTEHHVQYSSKGHGWKLPWDRKVRWRGVQCIHASYLLLASYIFMQKTYSGLLSGLVIIIFIFVIGWQIFGDDISSFVNHRAENRFYATVSDYASKQLESMEYGKDKSVDKIIEFQAQADNWNYQGPDGLKLVRTGDENIPFITTARYTFVDPKNISHYHVLQDTFIYDFDRSNWVPLVSDLQDYTVGKDHKYEPIKRYTLWQGDYQIPFFK